MYKLNTIIISHYLLIWIIKSLKTHLNKTSIVSTSQTNTFIVIKS
jgi:hypothetical protein